MEQIQISKEQEQALLTHFKKRASIWITFLIIGISGLIPFTASMLSESGANFYSSPTAIFLILGIIYWTQGEEVKKKILKSDYLVYKTECKTIKFSSVSVENNEILSKKIKKPIKWLEIVGTPKSFQAGDEIGVLRTGNDFWAFSFNEIK